MSQDYCCPERVLYCRENRKQGRCLLKIANVLFRVNNSRILGELIIEVAGQCDFSKGRKAYLIRASECHARRKAEVRNKTNNPILNLTPENITQHSGIE